MNITHLKRAYGFIWKIGKSWILRSILFSVLLGVLPVATVWVTKELVNSVSDSINGNSNFQLPFILLLLQFSLMVTDAIARHAQDYYDREMTIRTNFEIEGSIMTKVESIPFKYFDQPSFHDQLARIQNNAGSSFLSPVKNLFLLLESLISVVGLLVFLFSIHWTLGVISISALIPIVLIKTFYGNQQFWLNYYLTPIGRETSFIKALLTQREFGMEIKTFNLSTYLKQRWSERFQENASKSLLLLKKSKKAEIGLDGLSSFFYISAAGILIWLTKSSAVRIGEFVAIGQAVHSTQQTVSIISSSIASIYEDGLYINDYYSFIDSNFSELERRGEKVEFPNKIIEGIAVNNISLKYPNSEEFALKNISFRVKPGEKIAIIGHNGSGKSSLMKCLLGLYIPNEGDILIDGLNLNSISSLSRRKNITAIFQDFIKYPFTVKENIYFSDIERAEDFSEIVKAAQASKADTFVSTLPSQYNTQLGKELFNGTDLSGGQWQKLAISRAIFKNSQIAILDEPTAALDPEAEVELFKLFQTVSKEKVSFLVSHRMGIGKIVDRVLVLKEGELIEMGTHDELIAKGGEYARLLQIQSHFTGSAHSNLEVQI